MEMENAENFQPDWKLNIEKYVEAERTNWWKKIRKRNVKSSFKSNAIVFNVPVIFCSNWCVYFL